MKKIFIIFTLLLIAAFSGCNRPDNNREEPSQTEQESTIYETETETKTKLVLGNVRELTARQYVFHVSDSEETDDYVKWKNSAASAQLDMIGGWDDEINCEIKYESAQGSISGIKLFVQPNKKLNTEFLEADINCDGSDDLIIVYTVMTGTASTQQYIYAYDFKNSKEIKPVGDDGGSFTAVQEKDLLQYYKEWYDSGITEFPNIKDGAEGKLPQELFMPSLVEYNGQTAIKIKFLQDGPYDNQGISTAIICYEKGEFVVKELWFEQI